jgi:AhpD family alkylhydroperoxidase
MMPAGRLHRRETELVVLRVASLTGSAYELTQHRPLGLRAGLTPDEIEAITHGPSHPAWGPRDRLLLRAADVLVQSRDLPDGLWSQLRAELDDRELIELVMLVGHYSMLATTLHTLRVQPDRVR